jgi:hypothetical protein
VRVATSRIPGPLGFDEAHIDPERETLGHGFAQPSPLGMHWPSSEDIAPPPSSWALPPRPRLTPRPGTFALLRIGSRDAAVGRLQRLLNQRHASISPGRGALAVDQIFGPLTKQSVEQFQRYAAIESDGVVGPITWAHLLSDRLLSSSAGSRASGPRSAVPARPAAGTPQAAAGSVSASAFPKASRRRLCFNSRREISQRRQPLAVVEALM